MSNKSLLKEHAFFFEFLFKILDIFIVLLSSYLAYHLYGGILQPYSAYFQGVLIASITAIIVFQAMGLYRPWRGGYVISELKVVFFSWSILFLLLALMTVVTKTSEFYSRGWFIFWYGTGLSMSMFMRIVLRYGLRHMRQYGFNQRQVVVVGSGQFALEVVSRVKADKTGGFIVQGLFSDSSMTKDPNVENLGMIKSLAAYVEKNRIDQVWIAMPLSDEEKVKQVINVLRHTTVDIRYIPDIFGFNLLNHSFTEVVGLPVINLASSPMYGSSRMIKYLEDKILSSLILIAISPLLLAIAIGVKLSSPGPVFFRQQRIGWNNDEFTIYKFRSMPVDVEKQSGPVWAKSQEQRATRFGQFLRRTSLDELPQFFNVLKGDMSIVGPRPERPHFVDKFKEEIPGYMKKHMVKAGITGWAQVNGWRGNTDIKKRVEYDLYYIENWSLWLDFKIILLTVFSRLAHKNAY